MTAPFISLHGLTKRYGNFTAVDDVSIDVAEGSICGLLGPNGAGKTTTFEVQVARRLLPNRHRGRSRSKVRR